MPFACPSCGGNAMEITFSLELPPDDSDDEITLQTLQCPGCDFQGAAVYRESRRGSFHSESWHHEGYPISDDGLEQLHTALMLCPAPADRQCRCGTHTQFSQRNWVNPQLPGLDGERRFNMQLVR